MGKTLNLTISLVVGIVGFIFCFYAISLLIKESTVVYSYTDSGFEFFYGAIGSGVIGITGIWSFINQIRMWKIN